MNITLSYQTQHLPPPYAYAVVLNIKLNSTIEIDFGMEYLGRSEIPDEELKAEGFSKDDDFTWNGAINKRWKDDIKLFSTLKTKSKPDDTYLHIYVDGNERGFPLDISFADLLFQELVQAVYEQAEIEAPLLLKVRDEKDSHEIKWHFSKRLIEINGKESDKWNEGRSILKMAYGINYDSLKYSKKAQPNSINPGSDIWYSLKDKSTLDSILSWVKSN